MIVKRNLVIILIVSAFYMYSCSPSRDKVVGSITKMETDMKAAQKVDSTAVTSLLGAYQNFATRFPEDSLSPDFLYKAAGLAVGFNRGTQAIELYESIISKYPNYKRIPECYFMEAFTYENTIGNLGKASEYYNKFLSKYENHELADDAEAALKFLGKSPEEMVREFEEMNADTSRIIPKTN